MAALRKLRLRLRHALRRARLDSDLEEELSFHIEAKTREYIAAGMTPEDARAAAQRQFGNATYLKESSRNLFSFARLETVLADIRYALRMLRRSPGFTAAAMLVLALGLGANTAIFSVVNGVLLRPLPYPNPDRVVMLFERDVIGENAYNVVSPLNFFDWQKQARSYEQIAATAYATWNLSGPGALPEWIYGAADTWNMFATLGIQPVLGRGFTAADDRIDAPPVAIISHGVWQRRFGGRADVLGRQIQLDRLPYTVIGVAPPVFVYPRPDTQVWVPLRTLRDRTLDTRGNHCLWVIGRLKPGVSVEQARTELDGIARRIKTAYPGELTGKGANVVSLQARATQRLRTSLLVLLGAVGCVLLIACVNVGNLLLARASTRRRELAIRTALGAGRGRLFRQLLTEAVVLAMAGGFAGIGIAYGATRLLLAKSTVLPAMAVQVDTPVLLFTSILALATGIAVGVTPAFQWRRPDLAGDLKEGGRSFTGGRSRTRFRDVLVAVELALSLVLLTGAGLLLKSFAQLRAVNPGFRADHLLTMGMSLPEAAYRGPAQVTTFYGRLLERVRSLPGVAAAGIVSNLPLNGHWSDNTFTIEGHPPPPPGHFLDAVNLVADPGYFRAVGIPLRRGRTFTEADGRTKGDSVVVISESMARTFWPGEDPLGQYIRTEADGPRFQVIGVVGDVVSDLGSPPEPSMYFPLSADNYGRAFLAIRTQGDPAALASAARAELNTLDRNLAPFQVMTMDELLAERVSGQRFNLMLLGLFALLALLLAAVGLYGVISYSVAQRTNEIGVRMAMGAATRDVLGMVLAQGLRPAVAGIVIGLAAAAASTHVMRSMLFATSPGDPVTFAGVSVVLLAVAALACSAPALRATRVDPTAALRNE